jgi:t-SNARE complex subunit (syntaxin)
MQTVGNDHKEKIKTALTEMYDRLKPAMHDIEDKVKELTSIKSKVDEFNLKYQEMVQQILKIDAKII